MAYYSPREYSSRAGAKRAAILACRKWLKAPVYEAAEGPDFGIHPQTIGYSKARYRYELRGPALAEIEAEMARCYRKPTVPNFRAA